MISPCVSICKLEDGVCTGCKRKLHEIRDWSSYSDDRRKKIMERVKK